MKVRVIKANSSSYWYGNHIGETFEVEETPIITPKSGYVYRLRKVRPSCFLDANDVEIITEEFVFR